MDVDVDVDDLEPLDPDGEFCSETHPTAPSVRCRKRPHDAGCHVSWVHHDQIVRWGPAENLPGFSKVPRFFAKSLRDLAPAARSRLAAVALLAPAARSRLTAVALDPILTFGEVAQVVRETRAARPPRARGYSGDICGQCGSGSMVRTGKCLTCQNCGDSSGGCS